MELLLGRTLRRSIESSSLMELGDLNARGWELGFGDLENKNLALLAKWGWRFFNEVFLCVSSKEHTWRKPIQLAHQRKCFLQPSQFVDLVAMFKLDSCTRIALWHDHWTDLIPFKDFFPRLFRLSSNSNGDFMNSWVCLLHLDL